MLRACVPASVYSTSPATPIAHHSFLEPGTALLSKPFRDDQLDQRRRSRPGHCLRAPPAACSAKTLHHLRDEVVEVRRAEVVEHLANHGLRDLLTRVHPQVEAPSAVISVRWAFCRPSTCGTLGLPGL